MPQSPEPYEHTARHRLQTRCDAANDHGRRRRGDHAPASGPRSSTHHLLLDPAKPKPKPVPITALNSPTQPPTDGPPPYYLPLPHLFHPPTRVVNARGVDITSSPDARWYHFVFLVVAWHVLNRVVLCIPHPAGGVQAAGMCGGALLCDFGGAALILIP
ncbi:hypothetical protein B0H14DRAFT_3036743, partial [Mycena olivaceomarginata]